MPLAHIHLLHLSPTLPIPKALQILSTTNPPPITLSLVIRWIILPSAPSSTTTHLLSHPWTILLITLTPSLPASITPHLLGHYHLQTGIPSRLLASFPSTNAALLHPSPSSIPPLTTDPNNPRLAHTAQTLELTSSLLHWSTSTFTTHAGAAGTGAVSMLNLLAFKPGAEHKAAYQRYGRAFAEEVGKRRGGVAKLVGNIVALGSGKETGMGKGKERKEAEAEGDGDGWDEFALAHYPTIGHFVDMLGSEDYQEVNLRERVGSLRETCILCTSEVAVEEILGRGKGGGSRL